jgi:uncharacterized membrane protein YeaQ/YmgE (transglycosylase-associated protein family)
MNILVYLVEAAVIGWEATKIMNYRANLLFNIIAAFLGACLAGWLFSPIFHVGSINLAVIWQTELLTLAGSDILLAVLSRFPIVRRA